MTNDSNTTKVPAKQAVIRDSRVLARIHAEQIRRGDATLSGTAKTLIVAELNRIDRQTATDDSRPPTWQEVEDRIAQRDSRPPETD